MVVLLNKSSGSTSICQAVALAQILEHMTLHKLAQPVLLGITSAGMLPLVPKELGLLRTSSESMRMSGERVLAWDPHQILQA
jgi:hypothetical protein